MANLTEILQYDVGVYQIETSDPVLGGPEGITNLPLKNLANRTRYLKKHVDDLESGAFVPPGVATEAFVTAEINKLDNKQSVRAATTANITLAGTQTIDGVNLVSGDRILVKNQAAAAENGIYVVQGAGWTRAGDADSNADVTPGLVVVVEEGTLQGDTIWKLTTNAPIVLGTSLLTFADITTGYAPLASPTFTGDPKAPTPVQFDNDTTIATTAFVKAAGLQAAGFVNIAGTRTLDANDVGKFLFYGGSSPVTLTLPSAGAYPNGSSFVFFNGSGSTADVTFVPSGADTFNLSTASIVVKPGAGIMFCSVGGSWNPVIGEGKLRYVSDFAASLAAGGYQKLPGGLIMQWGKGAVGTAVTFPFAFPNSVRHVNAIHEGGSTSLVSINSGSVTVTGFNTNGSAGVSVGWFAIGH